MGQKEIIARTNYAFRFHPIDLEWLGGLVEEIKTYMQDQLNSELRDYMTEEQEFHLVVEASLSAKPGMPELEVISDSH